MINRDYDEITGSEGDVIMCKMEWMKKNNHYLDRLDHCGLWHYTCNVRGIRRCYLGGIMAGDL